LKLKVGRVFAREYLTLKRTLKGLEYDERKAPVLATTREGRERHRGREPATETPVESNAKILESTKELDIQDAHTAVYKAKYVKRILTYAGQDS